MKKTSPLSGISLVTMILFGAVALLSSGCGKNTVPPSGTPATPPATVSAEKTSFAEVTAQLDPGGDFYLYLGTAQWLEHLSTTLANWRTNFTAMPDLSAENLGYVNKAFDIANHLVQDSGVEDITGLGLSSVEIEKGMYHNKMLLHHYAGAGNGFLWKLCGQQPHALTGLDMLPANTALAGFSDLDLPLVWTVVQDEVAKSGFPEAQDFLQKLPGEFEKKTKLKWDDVLHSVGGELGFVLTLNESNTIPIPLPGAAMTIPEPGLLLVLKVNDDTIFNRLDQELKANPQVIRVDQTGLKLRTMPVPIPFVGMLRPSTASSGGYLFIASSDTLINDSLAVKSGKQAGLKGTEAFKRLARAMPEQGNQFTFMSERFGRILYEVQRQAMSGSLGQAGANAQSKWVQSLFQTQPAFAYSVAVNTPQGSLTVGNSSQSFANLALLPVVVVPAVAAAVALPAMAQAKVAAQRNGCINNLRQIDAAKQQWALEKNKQSDAVPTATDLAPYLIKEKLPRCPQGGIYTLGPVNESPKCSHPGHVLP